MQFKPLSLLVGALALTVTATPFAVHAQTNSPSAPIVAQGGKKGALESLGLSNEQKSRIQQIMSNSRTQIEAVFTPEQKAKLEAARQARQAQRQQAGEGRKLMAELNLTDAQKTRIRSIRESSEQQIEAILTPEQRTKLQQLRANARQRWQQNRNNQTTP